MHFSERIAIRAPDYFPGLPFLALMMRTDLFVLADTFQYSRQSFQNRALIRKPDGRQWLSVPLKDGQFGRPIAEVEVKADADWRGRHRRALYYNYRSSAMYEYFEPLLDRFFSIDSPRLADYTCASVALLAEQFGLACRIVRASELEGAPRQPDEIMLLFGRMEYVALADTARHDAQWRRDLRVLSFEEPVYRQNFSGFEPGLSGLDLLFNYGPEGLRYLREGIVEER